MSKQLRFVPSPMCLCTKTENSSEHLLQGLQKPPVFAQGDCTETSVKCVGTVKSVRETTEFISTASLSVMKKYAGIRIDFYEVHYYLCAVLGQPCRLTDSDGYGG